MGDIDTSPLYVMKAMLLGNGGVHHISETFVLGAVSLIFWTITLITTIKYVLITLRADNNEEGGIFSLYWKVKDKSKKLIIPAIIGGAMLLVDGSLTPAVTVTNAVEDLSEFHLLSDFMHENPNFIVILVILIISLIFMMQKSGIQAIGRLFGPVMII